MLDIFLSRCFLRRSDLASSSRPCPFDLMVLCLSIYLSFPPSLSSPLHRLSPTFCLTPVLSVPLLVHIFYYRVLPQSTTVPASSPASPLAKLTPLAMQSLSIGYINACYTEKKLVTTSFRGLAFTNLRSISHSCFLMPLQSRDAHGSFPCSLATSSQHASAMTTDCLAFEHTFAMWIQFIQSFHRPCIQWDSFYKTLFTGGST